MAARASVLRGLAWARSALRRWQRGRINDAAFQRELDTYRALLLLEHRALPLEEAADASAQRAIVERVESMDQEWREHRVQGLIHQQVKGVLQHLAAELSGPGEEAKLLPPADALSHRVTVGPSSIPSAGNGVFISGSCRPGSLVLFIPGLVYYAQHAQSIPGFPAIKDPLFMMTMTASKSIIDPYQVIVNDEPMASTYFAAESLSGIKHGHAGHVSTPAGSSSDPAAHEQADAARNQSADSAQAREPVWVYNRLGVGHMVNHAGAERRANVVAYDYVFPANVPDGLRHLVPHALYRPPDKYTRANGAAAWALRLVEGRPTEQPLHRPIPSQVLIAASELQHGQEVLVDYRFNPHRHKHWPDWYTPCDVEAARRRWSDYRY